MLWNKGEIIDPLIWLALTTHIELLIFGWLIQLALGVAFWIIPRFTQEPRYGNVRRGWIAFAMFNLGILLVVLSSWVTGLEFLKAFGRLMEMSSILMYLMVLWPRVKPFGV
jgi:heme/copper-type cytochrome/quinol oxidase subunit 1